MKKVLCLTGLIMFIVFVGGGTISNENSSEQTLSIEKLNYLVEKYIDIADYETATEYFNQLYREYGDIPQVRTAQLRLALAQGDMEKAKLIAQEINRSEVEEKLDLTKNEEKYLVEVAEGSYLSVSDCIRNQAMYNSLLACNVNPKEYGYTEITDEEIEKVKKKTETLRKEILDKIEDSIDTFEESKEGNTFIDALKIEKKLSESLTLVANAETDDTKEALKKKIEKYVKELLELYQQDNGVLALTELRNLFINACVITSEYDKLLFYADSSKDEAALATVAYLYLTKEIKDKDLKKNGWVIDFDTVIDKCKQIYRSIDKKEFTDEEIESLKSNLDTITIRNKNKGLACIEEKLSETISVKGGQAEDFIQGAAINSELLDTDRVYQYLDKALETKDTCTNQTLNELLNQMSSVADKSAEDNEIISFNTYLAESYEQSLVLKTDNIEVPESFINTGNVYVNEKRSKINIGVVKAEEFPKVRIYASTADVNLAQLKDLKITDCGINIEKFKIERAKYDFAQIMLVCDNSGSMSGDVDVLKNAVLEFIETARAGEKIGIVTFDSCVLQNVAPTQDMEILQDAVNRFGANGGTNIATGVYNAMEHYEPAENSFNVMIVMTDGQDSSFNSYSLEKLRETCKEKNVILYTIGLGSVSASYLEQIADSGMGSFVYCNNSSQLENLYAFIHNQLENNYVITYNALDTSTIRDREVTISSETEGYSTFRKYSIDDFINSGETGSEEYLPENENPLLTVTPTITKEPTKTVSAALCLGVTKIVKTRTDFGNKEQEFAIIGFGFDKADKISVSIQGKKLYAGLKYQVINGYKMSVTLPENVECDKYDIIVNIDGRTYKLGPLSIYYMSEETEFCFGDYKFTADSIIKSDGRVVLSGNVTMNEYLHFKEDITIKGTPESNMLVIYSSKGAYIDGDGKLPGPLADLFDNRISVPSMDGLTLYKEDHYDKYKTYGLGYYGPVIIASPYIEVHPEYLSLTLQKVSFDYPIISDLVESVETPFQMSGFEESIVLSKNRIGFILNIEGNPDFVKGPAPSLGKAKFSIESIKLKINTFAHDYGVGLEVGLKGVKIFGDNDTSYSLELGIASGKFASLDFGADVAIDIIKIPVFGLPVTIANLANFHVGVKDMASVPQDKDFGEKLKGSTFYGSTDVEFINVNRLIPGIDTLFGDILDVAILQMADTTLGLTISNFNVSAESTVKLFESIEMGKVNVDIGCYTYENYLLGIDNTEVTGVGFETLNDINCQFADWFKLNVEGSTNVDINKAFAGAMMRGKLNYYVKVFKKHTGDLEGVGLMGLHNNLSQFTIILKGSEYQTNKDIGIRVCFSAGNLLPEVDFY